MNELKVSSKYAGSLQPLLETVIADALHSTEDGIDHTQQRIREFEEAYNLSTEEFIERYENDEFPETLEFVEWIGEYRLLKRLQEKAERLRSIEFSANSPI